MSIALLDDHDVVRVGLRTVLESLGRFQIDLEAARGREFLWRASGLRLDAAIVDYQLGDMRGDEVCSRVRQMVPGRPDARMDVGPRQPVLASYNRFLRPLRMRPVRTAGRFSRPPAPVRRSVLDLSSPRGPLG